jgi:hypothetical protein
MWSNTEMPLGILKYPRRRFQPYHGNLLWIPARETSLGTSPNLISWDGSAPSTGWFSARATLSEIISPAPPFSPKALKTVSNDAGGTGWSYGNKAIGSTYWKYAGITATLLASVQAPTANLLDAAYLSLYDGVGETMSSKISKGDSWNSKSVSRKLSASLTQLRMATYAKAVSDANTADILYLDHPILTVPQSLSRDQFSRIIHPEGMANFLDNPGAPMLDGTDNIITFENDFIGTGAFTLAMTFKKYALTGSDQFILTNNKMIILASNGGSIRIYSDGVNSALADSNFNLLNKRYRLLITRAADGTANIYKNGVLASAGNESSGAPAAGNLPLTMGCRIDGAGPFNGWFDNVQVYNRVFSPVEAMVDYLDDKRFYP